MAQSRRLFIWQKSTWPELRVDDAALASDLKRARLQQGRLLGSANAIGLRELEQTVSDLWTDDALATAAIEGENFDLTAVRSSVMRRLGLPGPAVANRQVEGLVDVMHDATDRFAEPLDADRLCRWQSALFPGGTSGTRRIEVGRYRSSPDPMQIVGGPIGKETHYYTAPPAPAVQDEMGKFLAWFENTRPRSERVERVDGIVRAAIAHLWFETVHPFEDGNGRIGRVIVDLALAQDSGGSTRIYSLSRQLMSQRKAYYEALGEAQRGETDVTAWAAWFVQQFVQCCMRSEEAIASAIVKSKFWSRADRPLNERQRKVIQRLLDAGPAGFVGGMSANKYGHPTKVSKATATRDLAELLQNRWLYTTGQGKGTCYWLDVPEWGARD